MKIMSKIFMKFMVINRLHFIQYVVFSFSCFCENNLFDTDFMLHLGH